MGVVVVLAMVDVEESIRGGTGMRVGGRRIGSPVRESIGRGTGKFDDDFFSVVEVEVDIGISYLETGFAVGDGGVPR